ncbi:hypothetical protein [Bacteroides sp. 519]|uniref:hypothetical protein n=1 Tax=Bacteroides sp. 519 TaxID=2302937 RepID=UPI0013CFDCCE|nr:hypothetical protein [Bacteroides sp. 519]NDV58407.1 hypothetical protein [Bacteroides sp. 519]
MKAMRFLMMAVLTVFMGTTLTSCLDSDGGNYPDGPFAVTIAESYLGGLSVKADNGYTFNVSNPGAMELKYTDGTALTPTRAIIYVYLAEGEEWTKDKTTYNVSFAQDYGYMYFSQAVNGMTYEPLETETPVYTEYFYFGNGYFDVALSTFHLKDFSLSDFKLCVTGVEGETIKMKLMNSEELKSTDSGVTGGNFYISYIAPGQEIKNYYPELKTFGTTNDSVYVQLENKSYAGIESEKIKIKLR